MQNKRLSVQEQLSVLLSSHDVDAVIIVSINKIRWLTGFTGSSGLIVATREAGYFVTDPRYTEQSGYEVENADVIISSESFPKNSALQNLLKGPCRVLVEADHWTLRDQETWADQFPETEWVHGSSLLQGQISVKNEAELECMRQAQEITEKAFLSVVDLLQPGMTEKQVAAEIVYAHLRQGAERMSFDPIVASGPRSALPHARPTDRRLKKGELVLFDTGCIFQGYASDMTRMISLGEPQKKAREVYDMVRNAQSLAINFARADILGNALDWVAREAIELEGHGPYFTHGLGHGIGMDVHEWPRVSAKSKDSLPSGCVITIEPGIYLSGQFGIRIEDTIVLTKEGSSRLGRLTQELLIV